ncbi:MAG: hypothetical protein EHM88_10300 [Candidatus Rokuibacteriota bacterium]|jgi:hypothetical protein|nr:MAG: hypothetical protein EHM88_10300 [Candidatus Rokubacteria bacterium]
MSRGQEGPGRVRDLLAACLVLFAALLVWPLLTIANRPQLIAGVPALVLYLFGVWAVIVAVLAWAARRADREDGP